MVFDPQLAAIFLRNFNEAYRAAKRLQTSLKRLKSVMPFQQSDMENLSEEAAEKLDAFRVRLGDLQDCLGSKVFRGLLLLEEEKVLSHLDILNKIDKRGIIPSFEKWKSLRELRNLFSHDYPESQQERIEALNKAFARAPELIETLNAVAERAAQSGVDMSDFSPLAVSVSPCV